MFQRSLEEKLRLAVTPERKSNILNNIKKWEKYNIEKNDEFEKLWDKWEYITHLSSKEENQCLFELSRNLNDNDNVIEVGRFVGFSTIFLSGKHNIYSIDTCVKKENLMPYDFNNKFIGIEDIFPGWKDLDECSDLLYSLVGIKVNKLNGDSRDINIYNQCPIAKLIFVDGGHSYETCFNDLHNYWEKLENNGYIAIHDYNLSLAKFYRNSGVDIAVDEFIINKKISTEQIKICNSMVIINK